MGVGDVKVHLHLELKLVKNMGQKQLGCASLVPPLGTKSLMSWTSSPGMKPLS